MPDFTLSSNTMPMARSQRILYTASAFAKTSLLHLQEVGELQAEMRYTSRREGLSSYLFFVVASGSGVLTYGGKNYDLSAGDCVFIDCRKPYAHTTSEELWQLKWCHFYGSNMADIYDKYLERGGQLSFHPDSCTPSAVSFQNVV